MMIKTVFFEILSHTNAVVNFILFDVKKMWNKCNDKKKKIKHFVFECRWCILCSHRDLFGQAWYFGWKWFPADCPWTPLPPSRGQPPSKGQAGHDAADGGWPLDGGRGVHGQSAGNHFQPKYHAWPNKSLWLQSMHHLHSNTKCLIFFFLSLLLYLFKF
jgi:hypothetical protein